MSEPSVAPEFEIGSLLKWAATGGAVVVAAHLVHLIRNYLGTPEGDRKLPTRGTVALTGVLWCLYLAGGCVVAILVDAHSRIAAFYDGLSGPMLLMMFAHEGLAFFGVVGQKKP